MDFGMIPYDGLTKEAFKIDSSNPYFPKQIVTNPQIFIGLPKWTDVIDEKNKIKEKEALSEYIKQFNAIELNATHYKIYEPEWVSSKWASKAQGKRFLFCPKMFNGITNAGSLDDKGYTTKEFLNGVSAFKDNLGPVLIQLKEIFSPLQKDEIFNFLKSLPEGFQFFLELRHTGWFEDKAIADELFQTLHALGIGAVITDTPGRRDIFHMNFPIPKAYIRFICDGNNELDYYRMDQWKMQLKNLIGSGIQEVYFFLHIRNKSSKLKFAKYGQSEIRSYNLHT